MLPEQFTDRRQPRPGAPDFDHSVCWHLLLVMSSQPRRSPEKDSSSSPAFPGLHMTPLRWLHATVLLAGRAAT